MASPMPMAKLNKTCDQCRQRKIKCEVPQPQPGQQPTCVYCKRRGQSCSFSIFRNKARVRVPRSFPASSQPADKLPLGEIYIDRILQDGPQNMVIPDESAVFTASDEKASSSSLAFFSEKRMTAMTQKLGHSRLQDVMKMLNDFIYDRVSAPEAFPRRPSTPQDAALVSPHEADLFIKAYFHHFHPLYPFLDRDEFEAQASSPKLADILVDNPVFSSLYYCILATGSQLYQQGTYAPSKGKSWMLFEKAKSYMDDLVRHPESIEQVQALTAMCCYCLNTSGLQFDDYFASHAARTAILLRCHRQINAEPKDLRAFWVIYVLEKEVSFRNRTSSIIPDEDIGCVIPPFPEAEFEGFNWFVAFIRLARIVSIVYTSLFSVSASLRAPEHCQATMDQVHDMLEKWRKSLPVAFRPGDAADFPSSASNVVRLVAVKMHFRYYQLIIALDRLTLFLNRENGPRQQASKQRLMLTARAIIELTGHIQVQPHVPLFVLAVLPLSAVFILFDFVIHNPSHRESRMNLSVLDKAAGYFSLLSLAAGESLPGEVPAELTRIAREYYWKVQNEAAPSFMEEKPAVSEQGGGVNAIADPNLSLNNNEALGLGLGLGLDAQMMPGPFDQLNYPTPMDFSNTWYFPDWYMDADQQDSSF
ncbi:fungal-specific transcription factor domain-containing protein [Stachybotrys elegans]|uniref:Fungal-specific transcription factor domain-containing protein n=1 Tax=Stachybotrys elegans TaxID=80388 RepID=A0A8K0WQV9_9HYPO|nr:fungal-specific transcription factor domain-containing protein [Stachybotrys elegans]